MLGHDCPVIDSRRAVAFAGRGRRLDLDHRIRSRHHRRSRPSRTIGAAFRNRGPHQPRRRRHRSRPEDRLHQRGVYRNVTPLRRNRRAARLAGGTWMRRRSGIYLRARCHLLHSVAGCSTIVRSERARCSGASADPWPGRRRLMMRKRAPDRIRRASPTLFRQWSALPARDHPMCHRPL